jgi:hypothetical protein
VAARWLRRVASRLDPLWIEFQSNPQEIVRVMLRPDSAEWFTTTNVRNDIALLAGGISWTDAVHDERFPKET